MSFNPEEFFSQKPKEEVLNPFTKTQTVEEKIASVSEESSEDKSNNEMVASSLMDKALASSQGEQTLQQMTSQGDGEVGGVSSTSQVSIQGAGVQPTGSLSIVDNSTDIRSEEQNAVNKLKQLSQLQNNSAPTFTLGGTTTQTTGQEFSLNLPVETSSDDSLSDILSKISEEEDTNPMSIVNENTPSTEVQESATPLQEVVTLIQEEVTVQPQEVNVQPQETDVISEDSSLPLSTSNRRQRVKEQARLEALLESGQALDEMGNVIDGYSLNNDDSDFEAEENIDSMVVGGGEVSVDETALLLQELESEPQPAQQEQQIPVQQQQHIPDQQQTQQQPQQPVALEGLVCSVCGSQWYSTASGEVCANGHNTNAFPETVAQYQATQDQIRQEQLMYEQQQQQAYEQQQYEQQQQHQSHQQQAQPQEQLQPQQQEQQPVYQGVNLLPPKKVFVEGGLKFSSSSINLDNFDEGKTVIGEVYVKDIKYTKWQRGTKIDAKFILANGNLVTGVCWETFSEYTDETIKDLKGLVVQLSGKWSFHNKNPQITFTSLAQANVTTPDYYVVGLGDLSIHDSIFNELYESYTDNSLKYLIWEVFFNRDFITAIKNSPAGISKHDTGADGLYRHKIKVAYNVHNSSRLYPKVNRDVAVTAALLHDIGKVYEIVNGEYSEDGVLFGHIYMGAKLVENVMDALNQQGIVIDPNHRKNIIHCILSHHSQLDWGAVVVPATPEAQLLATSDLMDARVTEVEENLGNNHRGQISYPRQTIFNLNK